MRRFDRTVYFFLLATAVGPAWGTDWQQFRGPGGLGTSDEKGLPTEWSVQKNIAWKVKLPGAGASCPVTQGNRVFVTCYSEYALDVKEPGNMDDLRRHLVCLDRATGKTLWAKEFQPVLPEHKYQGEGSYHGYAASTPAPGTILSAALRMRTDATPYGVSPCGKHFPRLSSWPPGRENPGAWWTP